MRWCNFPQVETLRALVSSAAIGYLALSVAPVLAQSESPPSPSNWSEFRGHGQTGVLDDAELPTEFDTDAGTNIAWATELPGMAHSSPVVWNDIVFVTTAVPLTGTSELRTGDVDQAGLDSASLVPHSWRLYALNRLTGEILWHRVATEGVPRVSRHLKGSHASATPATNGQFVVALFDSQGLFAYDLHGNAVWSRDLGVLDVQWGPASSPIIHEDRVLIQDDRETGAAVVAFDLATGDEIWRTDREESSGWATPTVATLATPQIILNGGNWLAGYDIATGAREWCRDNNAGEFVMPAPVVADGQVILTGGYPAGGRPIQAFSLDRLAGDSPDETDAADTGLLWETERGSAYTTTPLVYRGILYVIVDNGIMSAYELASGERLYRSRLRGGGFSASPVASDGRIYLPSEDGDVFVVRAGREFELLAQNPVGETIMASPAITPGMLLIRGRTHLFGVASHD